VVISFDAVILAGVRKIEPTLMTGLLFDGQIENPLDKALEIGARQLVIRAIGHAALAQRSPLARSQLFAGRVMRQFNQAC